MRIALVYRNLRDLDRLSSPSLGLSDTIGAICLLRAFVMHILDPLHLPLHQSVLIEASAGTGKTYTMANLYLRLILGVGCEPLTVEQILVVTFTNAATQELRDRIRAKLASVAYAFEQPGSEEAQALLADPFLQALYQQTADYRANALLRLRIAEREMDLAAIFTIDSFCQKMLFQYAFDSGVRFDVDLQADESALLKRLSEAVWRELFYPTDAPISEFIAQELKTPSQALAEVEPFLSGLLPPLSEVQQRMLNGDYCQTFYDYLAFLAEVKQYWVSQREALLEPIYTDFARSTRSLNGQSYRADYVAKWVATLDAWAASDRTDFLSSPLDRFSQTMITEKTKENQPPIQSVHYEAIDHFIQQYEQRFIALPSQLRYTYFQALRQALTEYKSQHVEKNFTDMLTEFHQALHHEKGALLAEKIRQQFHFAMIDESQDTNLVQYEIFRTLFMHGIPSRGFILIGDPKQSIYQFRGADIFSYLNAAREVQQRFTLAKNWRSLPAIVEGINALFRFPKACSASPFLYEAIAFHPVESKTPESQLLNGQAAWNAYFSASLNRFDSDLAAEWCAEQIQRQLSQAAAGELFIQEGIDLQAGGLSRPLAAQDIAILVHSHHEAALMKTALAKRQIQSVFLSEKQSVYQSQEARDLILVLHACLHPYQQRALLAALATPLWGLNAEALYRLKNSETAWENYVEQFVHYQQVWQTQGILPMLHQLMMQQGILTRLQVAEQADRRITNLLHLSELLQNRAAEAENAFALLREFTQQVEEPDKDDEQILRLESEAKLVKIVTIHKSKGLEYPVVWLPFIAKPASSPKLPKMSLYRDAEHQLRWQFGGDDSDAKALKQQSEQAEALRLLYVALTRAKYQLHLLLPTEFGDSWNAFAYLLANGELVRKKEKKGKKGAEEMEAQSEDPNLPCKTQRDLEAKGIQAAWHLLDQQTLNGAAYQPPSLAAQTRQVRRFQGVIRTKGLLTSFSALQAQHERLQQQGMLRPLVNTDQALDHDREVAMPASSAYVEENEVISPYHFPRSARVGNLLHTLFEQWSFSEPPSELLLQPICSELNLNEAWLAMLQTWLQAIVTTPLDENGWCLADIDPQKRLNEWQFYLRLSNEKALPQLNRLLKRESPLASGLPDLQLKPLEGYVRGFIDLLVSHQGKFYVIDYKSNFLGDTEQDYTQEKLAEAVGQHRYDLQYLLYTLAVHRYLRSRLGQDYDYQRDFGGVVYLFLRGMNGKSTHGVFRDKPSVTLIDELDALFA